MEHNQNTYIIKMDTETQCSEANVDYWDLVSYRGPRSMVTVDMLVDTRSTHGRYLGRCIHRVSVDCRSSIRRVSVEHRPLYRRRIDRSLDHLRSRDRPTVGRDSISRVSAICWWTVGQVSVKYRSMHRPILGRHEKGTRILLCFKPVKPEHYSVIRWHIFALSLDLTW